MRRLRGRLAAMLRSMPPILSPHRTWEDHTRDRGLIPVLCDWRNYFAIDAEDRPVRAQYDDWHDLEEETDPRMRHLVLTQAAIRYPELERLRPVRRPGDPDCDRCGGSGTLAPVSQRTCWCGGTGWLPAGVPQAFEATAGQEAKG
jgi:hypothetical protein